MRVLILGGRADRPSMRFRMLPLVPYFEAAGHRCEIGSMPVSPLRPLRFLTWLKKFDAVVLQQKLLSRFELFLLSLTCRKLVFDVDDAVMYDSAGRLCGRRWGRFQSLANTAGMIVCGNEYLAGIASELGSRVIVVPTAIDTERFHPRMRPNRGKSSRAVIGWTGSGATNRYINSLFPTLARVSGNVKVAILTSDTRNLDFTQLGSVPHRFVRWSPENEVSETARFDIGLMPLPDNIWSRGKCGCKALQYMALGIPAVCSPVGVNSDIIEHGRTGFLPRTDEEWLEVLNRLVADAALRDEVGTAGRARVEADYSIETQAERFVAAVEEIVDGATVLNPSFALGRAGLAEKELASVRNLRIPEQPERPASAA